MPSSRLRALLRCQLLASAALVCSPAFAQDAPAATSAPSASEAVGADEIIVTAQKRSERLMDVPLSISASTGDTLKQHGISSPGDLQKVVPGFTYAESAYGAPIFTIRGIGFYDEAIAIAPTVSVYVDQVPVPFSRMAEGTALDLERVEVLKGPQGTLFGQNSTGGAINYIAAKPTDTFHAGADISYARFNSVDAQGYVSGPLADGLTARIAGQYQRSDDWQKSVTSDRTLGSRRSGPGGLSSIIRRPKSSSSS
jgi:iron complex outermembrane recepter protein